MGKSAEQVLGMVAFGSGGSRTQDTAASASYTAPTDMIVRDPPFSRIDLISCRNLLIYLDAETQQRMMPIFHYALRPTPGRAWLVGRRVALAMASPLSRRSASA